MNSRQIRRMLHVQDASAASKWILHDMSASVAGDGCSLRPKGVGPELYDTDVGSYRRYDHCDSYVEPQCCVYTELRQCEPNIRTSFVQTYKFRTDLQVSYRLASLYET